MLPLLWWFFAHLLILQYPDHHQNVISSSFYYSGHLHKISSQSVHNFLSNVVHRQTNRQTDKLTNATKNITSFAKEVIMHFTSLMQFAYLMKVSADDVCTAFDLLLFKETPTIILYSSNNITITKHK